MKEEPVVGEWTYLDAVNELNVPTRKIKMPDGTIKAEWIQTRSEMVEIEVFNPKTSVYEPAPPVLVQDTMEMAFDRSGVLRSWDLKTDEKTVRSDTLTPISPF
jgi:hypothetical protein